MRRRRLATCSLAMVAMPILFGGCGSEPDSAVPISVMALHTAGAGESGPPEYRQFDVLEPVAIDTGLVARPGTLRFNAQFVGETATSAAIAVRVAGHEIQLCTVTSSETWQDCVVPLPQGVEVAPVELAIGERGRYRLASLELAPAGSSSDAPAESAATGDE